MAIPALHLEVANTKDQVLSLMELQRYNKKVALDWANQLRKFLSKVPDFCDELRKTRESLSVANEGIKSGGMLIDGRPFDNGKTEEIITNINKLMKNTTSETKIVDKIMNDLLREAQIYEERYQRCKIKYNSL